MLRGRQANEPVCWRCWQVMPAAEREQRAQRNAINRTPVVIPEGDPLLQRHDHLWYDRRRVVEFILAEVGESARTELTKSPPLMHQWDAWRTRPFIRFDKVDEVLSALGLWVGDLGDPIYTGSAKRYPRLVSA